MSRASSNDPHVTITRQNSVPTFSPFVVDVVDSTIRGVPSGFRSTARLPSHKCGYAIAFDLGENLHGVERFAQLPRARPERTRPASDFAQHADRQDSTRFDALDDLPVETFIPKPVAEQEIDLGPSRQAIIQIVHLELTPIRKARLFRGQPGQFDSNRGYVHTEVAEPSVRQPQSFTPATASELQRAARLGQMGQMVDERRRGKAEM
jgi:hypothetical protein